MVYFQQSLDVRFQSALQGRDTGDRSADRAVGDHLNRGHSGKQSARVPHMTQTTLVHRQSLQAGPGPERSIRTIANVCGYVRAHVTTDITEN